MFQQTQAGKEDEADFRTLNGPPYPFLKEKESNRKNKNCPRRNRNQKQHYKSFLHHVSLCRKPQRRDKNYPWHVPNTNPPALLSDALSMACFAQHRVPRVRFIVARRGQQGEGLNIGRPSLCQLERELVTVNSDG